MASRVHRLLLIFLALLGIIVLFYLLFSGELDKQLSLFIPQKGQLYINKLGEPASVFSMFQLFHYVLNACMIFILSCALMILLKPIKEKLLLHFASGMILASWSAGLYFVFVDLEWSIYEPIIQIASISSSIFIGFSYYSFTRSFTSYPVEFSEKRRISYYQKISSLSNSFKKNKHSLLGKLRRRLLYWQLREFRKQKLSHVGPNQKLNTFNETIVFHRTGITSGVIIAFLLIYWLFDFYYHGDSKLYAFIVAPVFGIFFVTVTAILEKIKMDLELGDSIIRRKVLWIYLGLFIPLLLFIVANILSYVFVFIYPPIFGIVLTGSFTILPPIWFAFSILGIMISIYFFGAIDPELTLKTSTLYAIMGTLMTVVFVLAEQLISPFIINYTGLPGIVGAVLAGTLVAMIFAPLRSRVDHKIENILNNTLSVQLETDDSTKADVDITT